MNAKEISAVVDRITKIIAEEAHPSRMSKQNYSDFLDELISQLDMDHEAVSEELADEEAEEEDED